MKGEMEGRSGKLTSPSMLIESFLIGSPECGGTCSNISFFSIKSNTCLYPSPYT